MFNMVKVMVRKIEIIKNSSSEPIPDYPANFPPIDNLHLEMVENKIKLKTGLPLIPLKPIKKKREDTIQKVTNKSSNESYSVDKDMVDALKDESSSKHETKQRPQNEEEEVRVSKKRVNIVVNEEEEEEEEEVSVPPKKVNIAVNEEEEQEPPPNDEEEEEDDEEGEEEEGETLTPEEKEEKEKAEYLIKYDILKRKYKGAEIPDFNRHTSLHTLKVNYDTIVRRIHIDSSLKKYRRILIIGFLVIEFASTQWFGIDMRGFSKEQFTMMDEYDTLLIELGEKSYTNFDSKLPVELRILGMILIQAGIFYVGKIISEKAGETVSSLFRGMRSSSNDNNHEQEKHKMRGPSVQADTIRGWGVD